VLPSVHLLSEFDYSLTQSRSPVNPTIFETGGLLGLFGLLGLGLPHQNGCSSSPHACTCVRMMRMCERVYAGAYVSVCVYVQGRAYRRAGEAKLFHED